MKKLSLWQFASLMLVLALISPGIILADVSKQTKDSLDKLLLGKKVKPLVELPATKEGLDVYLVSPHGKRVDDGGLDLGAMSKELKSKGVGVEAQQWETITDVKVDGDHVEIHLGGGGEGRRGADGPDTAARLPGPGDPQAAGGSPQPARSPRRGRAREPV